MNLETKKPQSTVYNLQSEIRALSRISHDHAKGLERLHLFTVHDLLRHFPTRYADLREIAGTGTLSAGKSVTIYGVMEKVTVKRSFKGHVPMTEARIADNTGTIRCIWFNQAYIGKMYPDGTKVKIMGTVTEDSRGFLLSNPTIERASSVIPESQESLFATTDDTSFLTPVYPETKGVSSLYI